MKRMSYLALGVIAGLLFLAGAPLFAADGATASATINAGWFAQFAADYIVPGLGAIVAVVLGRLAVMLKSKWGVELDAAQREALQTALTNAAGLLIAKGVHMADGKTIDVGNPLIAQAVRYVQDNARGALEHFDLGPDAVAQKIVAKIGALGAAPAAIVASPAAPAPSGA